VDNKKAARNWRLFCLLLYNY